MADGVLTVKVIYLLVRLCQVISGILLLAMMGITCLDVVGNMFGHPVLGAEELVSLLAALLLAFALPVAEMKKAHIGIDILYRKLPLGARKVNDCLVSLLGMIFFACAAWQCFLYGRELQQSGQVSATLEIPIFWFLDVLSLCCLVLVVVIFFQLIKSVNSNIPEE